MTMHLRPYQSAAIAAIRQDWQEGRRDVLLVLPTGGGKTESFLSLLIGELKNKPNARGLILAHRKQLVKQPLERIARIDPEWLNSADKPRVGIMMASRNEPWAQLTIASVATLASKRRVPESPDDAPEYTYPRLDALLSYGQIDYLIHDEAHHAMAPQHREVIDYLKRANPDMLHLGVTATPRRADGKGLADVYERCPCAACEEERTTGKTALHCPKKVRIGDLVKQHYLVQPRWLAIDTGISLKGIAKGADGDYSAKGLAERYDTHIGRALIVKSYWELARDRRKTIAFVPTVESAYALADSFSNPEQFRDVYRDKADEIIGWYRDVGFRAMCIEGATKDDERTRIIDDFRAGRLHMLVNVDVLGEGFDAPGSNCVIMARPTKSEGRYLQCIGRGLRPAGLDPTRPGMALPGEDCLILEFIPEEVRDLQMAGDVLGEPTGAIRAAIAEKRNADQDTDDQEDIEVAVQAGFTFDGETFDSSGTPLKIVARQLDYLQASRWQWDRRDGWMTLGLGPGTDGIDRTLAIVPTDEGHTLYGLRREPLGERWSKWQVAFTRSGDLDYLCTLAEKQADKHAVSTLAQKGRGWHKKPASEGQIKYLRRLAKGVKLPGYLTSGEATSLITFYQVKGTIDVAI